MKHTYWLYKGIRMGFVVFQLCNCFLQWQSSSSPHKMKISAHEQNNSSNNTTFTKHKGRYSFFFPIFFCVLWMFSALIFIYFVLVVMLQLATSISNHSAPQLLNMILFRRILSHRKLFIPNRRRQQQQHTFWDLKELRLEKRKQKSSGSIRNKNTTRMQLQKGEENVLSLHVRKERKGRRSGSNQELLLSIICAARLLMQSLLLLLLLLLLRLLSSGSVFLFSG